ncbi:MAG TPA: hypothetical protein PKE12_00970 [Kiritimatiellia bacterium]|nr:hypothetical protein [Kiritimatiellia bacterium]
MVEELEQGGARVKIVLDKEGKAWAIRFGNIYENNLLLEELVEISILNKSECELKIMSVSLNVHIARNQSKTVFAGTMESFWINEVELLCDTVGRECDIEFVVNLRFKGLNKKLPQPLVITASISDSL